jgi:hypothetical protein
MADEKIIRISADASGFGSEINRISEGAKKAFSEIGLDGLFDEADRQFDKFEDKIKSISDELKKKQSEANADFDSRKESGGNSYHQRAIDSEQGDYNKRHDSAIKEWEKFVDKLRKTLDKEGINNSSDASSSTDNNRKGIEDALSRGLGNAGGDIGQSIGKMFPGNIGQSIGKNLGNLLNKGGQSIGKSLAGSGEAAIGAEAVGAAEAGGAGAAGAAGMGGALAAAGVVAVVAAVAMAIKQLYGMGMDDWRTESKINSTFNIDRDTFGKGGDDFGMDNKEYKEFFLSAAKSRGSATDIENIGRKELSLMRGYGLDQGQVQSFDKFNFQDVTQKDGTAIIVDILSRSEKQGILGVSGGDFSRLPEKLEQVSNIMAFQKASGEKVNSLDATNFMSAGGQIGGRFGDDRASEVYGRMNESIKNPGNAGMKAYVFEMLKKSNPNASFTDLQGMMENGASGDNLKAILPSISKMPQGEMRRMVLYQLTKNMQDAIRLDNAGSLPAMISSIGNKGTSSKNASNIYDTAMKRTETMDQLGKVIVNGFTDVGEKYIARPINDLVRGMMQKDDGKNPYGQNNGRFDSNTGTKRNAVTPKSRN